MKTLINSLFAVSSLTAFIATSIPSVSAMALSPAPHVARHLTHAHMAKVRRNMNKKRCKAKTQPKSDSGGVGSSGGSGGSSSGGSSSGGGSSGFGGKKGLAFPMGCGDLQKWHPNKDVHWHYNWRPDPYGDCPGGLPPFIPMLWGWGYEDAFEDAVRRQNPHTVLFINEPDMGGPLSSGISPGDACGLWNRHMAPLQQRGVRVGSAATTSAPYGKQWMQEFERNCGCRADFMAIHYYDTTVEGFIAYATDWHNTFGRNIWVTEMACQNFNGGEQCGWGQIWDFVGRISHWCETTSWIEAYTFFGAMSDVQNVNYMDKMMVDGGTDPNDLGNYMLGAY